MNSLVLAALILTGGVSADFSGDISSVQSAASELEGRVESWSSGDGLIAALGIQGYFPTLSSAVASLASDSNSLTDNDVDPSQIDGFVASIVALLNSLTAKANDFDAVGALSIVQNDLTDLADPATNIVNNIVSAVGSDCNKIPQLTPALSSISVGFSSANSAYSNSQMSFNSPASCPASTSSAAPTSTSAASSTSAAPSSSSSSSSSSASPTSSAAQESSSAAASPTSSAVQESSSAASSSASSSAQESSTPGSSTSSPAAQESSSSAAPSSSSVSQESSAVASPTSSAAQESSSAVAPSSPSATPSSSAAQESSTDAVVVPTSSSATNGSSTAIGSSSSVAVEPSETAIPSSSAPTAQVSTQEPVGESPTVVPNVTVSSASNYNNATLTNTVIQTETEDCGCTTDEAGNTHPITTTSVPTGNSAVEGSSSSTTPAPGYNNATLTNTVVQTETEDCGCTTDEAGNTHPVTTAPVSSGEGPAKGGEGQPTTSAPKATTSLVTTSTPTELTNSNGVVTATLWKTVTSLCTTTPGVAPSQTPGSGAQPGGKPAESSKPGQAPKPSAKPSEVSPEKSSPPSLESGSSPSSSQPALVNAASQVNVGGLVAIGSLFALLL